MLPLPPELPHCRLPVAYLAEPLSPYKRVSSILGGAAAGFEIESSGYPDSRVPARYSRGWPEIAAGGGGFVRDIALATLATDIRP